MEKKSFSKNAFACLLAGLMTGPVFMRTSIRFFPEIVPRPAAIGFAALFLLFAIVFIFVWYRKEKNGTIDSTRTLAWWQGLLRYGIAFDLSMIGWQKIFHLQFNTPIGKLDYPFSSFTLTDLVWAFFGRSYGFSITIGLFQIAGAFLLLFNRTRLLAVFILLPVMLNIMLIDYFYEIYIGPSIQAAIITAGVLYFFFIEYDRLKTFFFLSKNDLPSIHMNSNLLRNGLRLSVVIIPLLTIITNKQYRPFTFQYTPLPEGRYEVQKLVVNQRDVKKDPCNDSILTMVYLQHDVVFEYNHTMKRLFGEYRYDENTRQMTAVWHYPKDRKDSLIATVTKKENALTIDGKMGTDLIRMELVKVDPPKYP